MVGDGSGCDMGWTEWNVTGFCYQIFTVAKTWENASLACQAEGGELATIFTTEENDFIMGEITCRVLLEYKSYSPLLPTLGIMVISTYWSLFFFYQIPIFVQGANCQFAPDFIIAIAKLIPRTKGVGYLFIMPTT